ncbi:MAG: imidazolonepropionase [Acidobacteriota bacterium]|nr:MAG: imidazolonepropionase [Acidobacteriota bacterium]
MNCDLIIHSAAQLVTCASGSLPKRGAAMQDVGIIEDGAVAVLDGKFVGVGNTKEILNSFAADEIIDARGKVVLPGFVDPHTHIVYAGDRLNEFELKIKGAEYLDILAAGGGIVSTVKNTRAATIEELVELGLERLDKMLACGTTACEIKTGYGLDTETELKMLAIIEILDSSHTIDIVPTFLAAHTVPPEFKDRAGEYIDLVCEEMMPLAWKWYENSHFSGLGRRFYCDIFTERNSFDLAHMSRLFTTAREIGFGIKAHVDQFTNLGGSGLAVEMNAASIDHLDVISEIEIDALSRSDTLGIVIPTENFNSGKIRFADARRLIDAGCAVAISTDYNPGSAPCPSLPMAMAIACRYQKLLPAEAMNAATINAAFAIGLGEGHGSIEVGKQADLVLVDASDYRQMSYEFGILPKMTIIKTGEHLSLTT